MTRPTVGTLIGGVAVAAGVSLAATGVWGGGQTDALLLAILAAGFGLTLAFPLRNTLSTEVTGLELQEALILPAVVLLPAWPTVPSFALAATVAMIVRRRGVAKGVFNVAQWVVAVSLAFGVMAAIEPGSESIAAQAGPAVLATAVASIVNFVLVAAAVTLATGGRFRLVSEGHLWPSVMVWLGNVSLGVLLLVVAAEELAFLPIVLVPAAMMQLSYRAIAARSAEGQRLVRLGRAELSLAAAADSDALAALLADHARALLDARGATVTVGDGDLEIVHTAGDADDSARPVRGSGELEQFVRVDDTAGIRVHVSARQNLDPFADDDRQLLSALLHRAAEVLARMSLFETVKRERQKLDDVVSSSSEGIFSVDGRQVVQSWNPAMAAITGRPASDVVGRPCHETCGFRTEEGNALCPDTCPGRCGLHERSVPVQVTTRSGEARWLQCTYSPLPEGGYVVIARDVTAQREVDEMKADFLATVSHELRTPLTPIKGFIATLRQRDADLAPMQRSEMYDVLQRQAERLERLVADLLEATSFERQPQLFLMEALDWPAAAARVVDLFAAQSPGHRITIEVLGDVDQVVADEQRAEQVLANLLSNAVKYSPPGSTVRVTLEQRGDAVVTTVLDQGPGIDAVQRQRIFERFTRLGDYRTRSTSGAGLGLYIAARLVEGMGGAIGVADAPGGGAAFSFSLPVHERAAC